MKSFALILLLFSYAVIGSGIVEKFYTDQIQFGIGTSSDDKELVVDTGDGANNPKIKVDGTTKEFSVNTNFTVGTGTASDQKTIYDNGSGANNPFIGYDQATGKLVFSNDGVLAKKLGTGGGGGGGGINAFGDSDNANAEDGLTGAWVSVGGVLSLQSTAFNVIEGDNSFVFTPSSVNDKIVGPTLNFNLLKYHGITCELGIEYYGADENLELHVVDANGDILNRDLPNNRKIQARTQSRGPFSVSFICPTQAAITGDANKGNLHVEIKNIGAGISPAITWDLTYIGDDRNIGTSVLSNKFSFKILSAGGIDGIVGFNYENYVSGCVRSGVGVYDCTFTSLDFAPVCNISSNFNMTIMNTLSNTSMQILTRNSANAQADADVQVNCAKSGADANKVVKTYKSTPIVSETVNTFGIEIATGGIIESDEYSMFSGSCVLSGASNETKTCPLTVGFFSEVATFVAGACQDIGTSVSVTSVSLTELVYTTRIVTNTGTDRRVCLTVHRNGSDIKKPQTKNISLVGIVTSGYAEKNQVQLNQEHCYVINGTSPIAGNDLCSSWVDSISFMSTGVTEINITSGTFSKTPVCTCVGHDSSRCNFNAALPSISNIPIVIRSGTNVPANLDYWITCTGEK